MDGRNRCEGRIEVYHNGTWGTVCDDLWDINAARVVCQQLGCGEGVGALGNGHFGAGTGHILLDNVQCRGDETTLGQCRHLGWSVHNCGHHEDAGAVCSGTHPRSPETAGEGTLFSDPICVSHFLLPPLCFTLIQGTCLGFNFTLRSHVYLILVSPKRIFLN